MPQYREVTQTDLQNYLDLYGKGTILEYNRIKSGLANSNYRLVTNSGTYLLKICEEKPLEHLEVQLIALDSLKNNLFPSAYPYPIVNELAQHKYIKTGDPCVILYEFIEGKTGVSYEVTTTMATSIGHVCAQLHTIPVSQEFILADPRFTLADEMIEYISSMEETDPFYNHSFVQLLREKKDRFQALLATDLPMAYVHGDIFADNCLFDDKGVVNALIDFEEVCYAPALVDVSMTLLGCFYKKDATVDEELITCFINGYNEVRPLSKLELELLPEFVDLCSVVSSFWRFRQFNLRHPHLGLQENYKELLERSTNNSFDLFYKLYGTQFFFSQEPITFESTRGGVKGVPFDEAIMQGYACDGGLFMPSRYPIITPVMLKGFKGGSYPDLVKVILSLFIGDLIPKDDLNTLIDESLALFTHKEVIPLVKLDDYFILEMFWGPTGAFKDLSLILLERLIDYIASKSQKKVNILVGTSGDTGSAAIHGCRGCKSSNIFVLYPEGRVSRTQELQINTHHEENVHVYAVDGTSDDLDVPIKSILNDKEFCSTHNIVSTNSINLGRVLLQTVHYFYGYVSVLSKNDIGTRFVSFSVPTGACGNLCGGFIAKEMGLPIHIVSGVNENDIVDRTFKTSVFSTGSVKPTSSPSMDIQVPYNWERICYILSNRDTQGVKDFMSDFDSNHTARMKDTWVERLHKELQTFSANCEQVRQYIKELFKKEEYILDPHTSVGALALMNSQTDTQLRVCLSTATPHKFGEFILETLNIESIPNPPNFLAIIESLEPRFERLAKGDNWEQILRNKIKQTS